MMRPGEAVEVYLCRDPVDLRKSIQGLSVLVEQALGQDPFAQRLFVFCGRRRDKIKILYWVRVSDHREHQDRVIVNTQIGIVNT